MGVVHCYCVIQKANRRLYALRVEEWSPSG